MLCMKRTWVHEKNNSKKPPSDIKEQVKNVRGMQQKRYGKDILNAHIKAKEIEEFFHIIPFSFTHHISP